MSIITTTFTTTTKLYTDVHSKSAGLNLKKHFVSSKILETLIESRLWFDFDLISAYYWNFIRNKTKFSNFSIDFSHLIVYHKSPLDFLSTFKDKPGNSLFIYQIALMCNDTAQVEKVWHFGVINCSLISGSADKNF